MLSDCLDGEVGSALVIYRSSEMKAESDPEESFGRTGESEYDLLEQERRTES
jgi:hypothetical protein